MALVAAIGALRFELAGVIHGRVPEFEVRPVAVAEGVELGVARFAGRDVLVLDHRSAPGGMTRMEFWAASGPCERGSAGLLLMADARPGVVEAQGSLGELLRRSGNVSPASTID